MCTYLDQVGSTYYFRRVVPLELRPFIHTRSGAPRAEWKISLKTKDRSEAKRLIPEYTIATQAEIDAAQRLQAATTAGTTQERPAMPVQRVSGRRSAWIAEMQNRAEEDARAASEDMARREAEYDSRAPLRERLEAAFRKSTAARSDLENAALDIIRDLKSDLTIERERRVIAGIQSAERKVGLSPAPVPSILPTPAQAQSAVPLLETFDAYVKASGMSAVTAKDWRGVIRALIAFLGHDDAARIMLDDLDRWRDHLLAETTKLGTLRNPKTVKEKYFSALSSTLNYAVGARLLTENLASKVAIRIPKQLKLRNPEFTNAEAQAILAETLKPQDAPELTQRARRWIPWLCAYTGARVNEMSQLRGEDVSEVEGVWTIRITPEAGTVKSGEARIVPLHPHLIEQGFLKFIEKAGSGALFYDPSRVRKPGAANRHVSKVGERLAAWVRSDAGVTDPNVSPNHGWRHLFKTRTIESGMPERIADAIQGHSPRNVGQTYGSVSVQAKNEAVTKLPRFDTG